MSAGPDEVNPFFVDMPLVLVVTQKRNVTDYQGNTQSVETPMSDCKRVWGRAVLSTQTARINPLINPLTGVIRITPEYSQIDNLRVIMARPAPPIDDFGYGYNYGSSYGGSAG